MESQEIELSGHIIDSLILPRIYGKIMDLGGEFNINRFEIGKSKKEPSYVRMTIYANNEEKLDEIINELQLLGAKLVEVSEIKLVEVTVDGVAPDNFYSTTNHRTYVYYNNRWLEVEDIEMDCFIVVEGDRAYCKPFNQLKRGDKVVVGTQGIRIKIPERKRERDVFAFMTSSTSSEKPVMSLIKEIARIMVEIKRKHGKIVVVAGPAVVHTGARESMAWLIDNNYVDGFLAGNAVAVHGIEAALLGTSLGVNLETVSCLEGGHKHHLIAINEVRKAGSIKNLVEKGILKEGIMYKLIVKGIDFVLAGSIRDDGPLPEVITDTLLAQNSMRKLLKDSGLVLMFATLLHSIAVGNMIPSHIKTICVDINPASVTKLLDRGSSQTIGITSDVGLFLPALTKVLKDMTMKM